MLERQLPKEKSTTHNSVGNLTQSDELKPLVNIFEQMTALLTKMAKATSDKTLIFFHTKEVEVPRERPYPHYLHPRDLEPEDMEMIESSTELEERHINEFKADFKELLNDPKTTPLRVKLHILDFYCNTLQAVHESYQTWQYTGWSMLQATPLAFFTDPRPARKAERLINDIDKDMQSIEKSIGELKIENKPESMKMS